MPRQIAVHRLLFCTHSLSVLSMQRIALNQQGEVLQYAPFTEEQAGIEWWGGMMILSPVPPTLLSQDTWASFTHRLLQKARTLPVDAPLRAYYLPNFDVIKMELTPCSTVRPIHPEK